MLMFVVNMTYFIVVYGIVSVHSANQNKHHKLWAIDSRS